MKKSFRILIATAFVFLLLISIAFMYCLFTGKILIAFILMSVWGAIFFLLVKNSQVTKEID